MSPVSRGRKSGKNKSGKNRKSNGNASGRPGAGLRSIGGPSADAGQSAFTVLQSLMGPPRRPEWFDSSIKTVLDRADVVMSAQGPRELEQATAELLGAELHRIVHEERQGMWFDWWWEQLVEAAVARIREEVGRDGAWQAPWWLLHGLTSIGSPALRSTAQTALGRAKKELRGETAASQPEWLRQLPHITATGEVWEMRDAYGGRIAVIAGFSYPDETDPSVFLFDIDACGLVDLVHADVFDNVEQAAAAWRTIVGDTADDARPSPVETAERLYCLVHCDTGEETLRGTEPRAVMDNWFRARRRIHDLADALRKRGMPLPEATSLFRDIDTEPMAKAFTAWHLTRHGVEPDLEAVDALAAEWLEGTLPGTRHAASPHRAQYQLNLISDWMSEHPVTVAAKALLPEWVRWNGEQAGLPEHLIDRAVAVANGDPRR